MDTKRIVADLVAGRAHINWAVFQFPDDPKLLKLQEGKPSAEKIQEFLDSLSDDDPYGIRELPAIGGVKQYIVMGREKKLPFMEGGLTEKHAKDEVARSLVMEQLAIYADKFPWTQPMIMEGLKKARTKCKGCSEQNLLKRVAQAVKDRLDKKPTDNKVAEPVEDGVWGAREPCPFCTLKHLAQAVVLLNESITGYPTHRWYAIGHIAEAEAEAPTHEMANRIRELRLQAMDDLEVIPNFSGIIEELDALVREEPSQ